MCDNDHYHMEKEERLTTTEDTIGQGEWTTMTTMTRMTAMTTVVQDRLEERGSKRGTTTSFDGSIRLLTDFRR